MTRSCPTNTDATTERIPEMPGETNEHAKQECPRVSSQIVRVYVTFRWIVAAAPATKFRKFCGFL